MSNDSIDDLFEQAAEEADEDRWDFEENPIMKGILVGVTVAPGTQYGPFYVLRIKEESGTTYGVAVFGTVFNSQVVDKAPKIGAPIGIKYEGLKPNKAGDREYKSWVVVSGGEDFPAWQELGIQFMNKGRPSAAFTQGTVTPAGGDDAVGDFF